jgi:hypothetical protein
MFVISETVARHRLFRNAAMATVVLPVALLAACSHEQPAPPPAQPVQAAPPPAPAPAPVPPARG